MLLTKQPTAIGRLVNNMISNEHVMTKQAPTIGETRSVFVHREQPPTKERTQLIACKHAPAPPAATETATPLTDTVMHYTQY